MQQNKDTFPPEKETATLAGGCFWCLEAVFAELKGVEEVIPGYAGGSVENPSYREVSAGTTGHAEAVQVSFNPAEISYREILDVFFTIHDPTTLNRQGADVGTQYRSAIFYHSDRQKKIAEKMIGELDQSAVWDSPVVTEVTSFENFYPAEDHHRDYYKRHSDAPYCRLVIEPKVAKMRKQFMDKLRRR